MDPELARAVVPGAFALLGTLLGALIAGFVAYRVAQENRAAQREVARENRETQLALAREAARRDWRRAQLADWLTQINQRTSLYTRILVELRRGRQRDVETLMEQLPQHMLPATDLRWASLEGTPIGPLARQYAEIDTALLHAMGTPAMPHDQRVALFNQAVLLAGQINNEAERYVVGDAGAP